MSLMALTIDPQTYPDPLPKESDTYIFNDITNEINQLTYDQFVNLTEKPELVYLRRQEILPSPIMIQADLPSLQLSYSI